MARDILLRLAALEEDRHYLATPKVKVWINDGNGIVRDRSGRVMTKDSFDAAFPRARHITLNLFGEKMSWCEPIGARAAAASGR